LVLRKHAEPPAIKERMVKIIMGPGELISATIGAITAEPLLIVLAKPKAV
jgi:hypothetical protein